MPPSPSTPKITSSNGRSSGQRPPNTRDTANSGAGNSERRQDFPTGSTVTTGKSTKRKKNRHRKRRNRRQSFLGPEESSSVVASASVPDTEGLAPMATDQTKSRAALPFYKLGRDLSSTSLESEALLDHRYVLTSGGSMFGRMRRPMTNFCPCDACAGTNLRCDLAETVAWLNRFAPELR